MSEVTPQKLLVLDLDETLIHASTTRLDRPEDFIVYSYFVYKRPFLTEFIDYCFKKFKLAVWSSSSRDYCLQICSLIFPPDSKLEFVWSEERCTLVRNFNHHSSDYVKDFRKIKRRDFDLDHVLMLDDSPEKHSRNFGNLIRIKPWEGDPSDIELRLLPRFLQTLEVVPSVRAIEKRFWRQTILAQLNEGS